jgi:hypothetical protein
VIEAHPEDYASGEGWCEDLVRSMRKIVPCPVRGLLDKLLVPDPKVEAPAVEKGGDADTGKDGRRLGW